MQKVHLDTDLGGDIDDLCALAMLLRWSPPIELTGITVVGDTNGKRTGMVRAALEIAGRSDIPVAAGAETSQGYYPYEFGLPPEERYWPHPIKPSPNPPAEAVALLKASIEQGATLITIGPLTNLYLLGQQYPALLPQATIYTMGGYLYAPRAGLPQWRAEDDFNVQVDMRSARYLLQNANPTLITLASTVETALRRVHLDPLRQSGGELGRRIAKQAQEFALDEKMATKFGAVYERIPADIINFQHDALACAVALGWREGIEIGDFTLSVREDDGWISLHNDPAGRAMRVVTQVDGTAFSDFWLATMTRR